MRGSAHLVEQSGVSAPREGPLSVSLRSEIMVGGRRMCRSGVTSLPLRCPMAGVIYSKEAGEALTGEPLAVRPRHVGCVHGDPWSPARPSRSATRAARAGSTVHRAVTCPRGVAHGLGACRHLAAQVAV
jgi:hypothetical protein